jgi:hypothetical protein
MAASSEKLFSKKAQADSELIEAQISQLQTDLKAIAESIASLAQNETRHAGAAAKNEFDHLAANGRKAISGLEDEIANIENELKKTIRAKPLTAVLGAVALGYLFALFSR